MSLEGTLQVFEAEPIQDLVIVPARFNPSGESHQGAVVDGLDDKEKTTGDQKSVHLIENGIEIVCMVEDMRDVDHFERCIPERNRLPYGRGGRSDSRGPMGPLDRRLDSGDPTSISDQSLQVVTLSAADIEDAKARP